MNQTYQFADLNGTRIHYEVRGEGTAVTFIHAGIANLHMWDVQMDDFAASHRALRYDVRGWGETIWNDAPYSNHEDLCALLHHLDIEKTVLVGCSWGGKIALDFALAYPEMVTALVLVDTSLGGYEWTSQGFADKEKLSTAALEAGEIAQAAELEAQIWVDGRNRTHPVENSVRQHALALIENTFTRPEGSGEQSTLRPPALERLDEIQVPVRILVGEYDWPDVHAIAELLEAKLPLAEERTIVLETAHLPNMERPSRFNKIVLGWLEKLAWRSTIYAILPHPVEAKVWLRETEQGFALPHITMTGGRWDTTEADVERPLRQQLGDVRVLYLAHFQQDEAAKTTQSVFVLDNVGADVQNGRWVNQQKLQTLQLAQPDHQRLIENSLQEWTTGQVPTLRPPWARRGWYGQAAAWIENSLQQAGHPLKKPLEIVRSWGLSYVMKAYTDDGTFFFKTVAPLPLFVNEAITTSQLTQLFPQHVLARLAMDAERDWMLIPALEHVVGWEAPLSQRAEFLRQFARLQITAVSHINTLFAASLHDRRLDWTSAQIEPLLTNEQCQQALTPEEVSELANLVPFLQNLFVELANTPIPQTLVHGDLHGGNVGVQNGSFVFFDWTDACITHPFFDMLDIFFEEDTAVQTELRDAYLAEWTEFAPMPQLLQIWQMAEIGAAVHHGLSYLHILLNLERHSWSDMGSMLPFWLRKILTLSKNLQAGK